MSLTGGISFYDKSKCLFNDGATAATSSNTAAQNLMLGSNKYFRWESIGSDDSTTETITITLSAATAISRIFLMRHNFKAFQIQYDNGTPADFANVVGIGVRSKNLLPAAAEDDFTDASWQNSDTIPCTISANAAIAPDGTLTADQITPGTLGNPTTAATDTNNRVFMDVSGANKTYTETIYIKSVSGAQEAFSLHIVNRVSDDIVASINTTADAEWKKIEVSGLTNGASAGVRFVFKMAQSVYVWEARLTDESAVIDKIDIEKNDNIVSYFEFDSVTTDTIILTVDKTQTVDAEKFITEFICTNEIGTLIGYPNNSGVTSDRDISKEKSVTGRYHIQKNYETASFDLSLKTYPEQDDIDILDGLHDREQSFLVWLCGGLPDNFVLKQRGFRVEDLYLMQIDSKINNSYYKNVHVLGADQKYSFLEVAT